MSVENHMEHSAAGVEPMSPRPRWAWGERGPEAAAEVVPAASEVAPAAAEKPVGAVADRPSWAWGADPPAGEAEAAPAEAPAPPLSPPVPEPAGLAVEDRPAWSWGAQPPPSARPAAPPPRPGAAPPYVVDRAPRARPGVLARALARARVGAAATPVDRTAARVERVLVMAVLVAGWAVSLSSPRFAMVLPVVAVTLLAATVNPTLSVPRLISARVLPATRLAGPRLTQEDPAPHRLGQAATGLVLVLASLCAILGAPVVAWTLGWAVIGLALIEFTFDFSVGALIHTRLRRAGLLRI